MLNILSILIGLVGLLLVTLFFIPLFGIGNWLVVPIAAVGAGIGALSSGNAGRNLNLIVLLVAVVRLWLGGGIL